MNGTPDEEQIRRYLLSELEEPELGVIDEKILGDDEFFELVQAIEEELITEFVMGDLSAAEQERFERYFLTTPDRRRRTEVARLLNERGHGVIPLRSVGPRGSSQPTRLPWRGSLMLLADLRVAATIAAILIGGGVLWWSARLSSTYRQAGAPTPAPTSPAQEPATPSAPPPATILAVTLAPGLTRGAQAAAPVLLAPEVRTVRLQLEREQGVTAAPNVVSIETPEGRGVWTGSITVPPGASATDPVAIDVPADVLGIGDYLVFLYADDGGRRQTVAEYALSVRRGSSP